MFENFQCSEFMHRYEHVYFANAGKRHTEDIKTTEKHACKTKYYTGNKRVKCVTETIGFHWFNTECWLGTVVKSYTIRLVTETSWV